MSVEALKATNPDSAGIRAMFDNLAERYDLFNDLTSLWMAGRWRRRTLEPVARGMRVLDLGCGTGDLAIAAARRLNGNGSVTGLDFSPQMLAVAERRADREGLEGRARPKFILQKAEQLPVEDQLYDQVVSAFVLRNLYQSIDAVLRGVFHCLKPGGRISFLDITEPRNAFVRALWRFYMNTVVVLYGKLLFGKHYPLFYLTESARRFPKADEFTRKLAWAGFTAVRAKSFLFGIVTLYQAEKSSEPSARVAQEPRSASGAQTPGGRG